MEETANVTALKEGMRSGAELCRQAYYDWQLGEVAMLDFPSLYADCVTGC